MGIFIFIAAIIAILAGFVFLFKRETAYTIGGVAAILIGVLMILGSTITIVPTKQVGIPVTFGKPGEPHGNGAVWAAPWTDIVIMDATIQDEDSAEDNPTPVKDKDNADIYVHNLVRWSIKEDAADTLYKDYKDFDRVSGSLVRPEINSAFATVMSDYDPLSADKPTYDKLAEKVKTRLQERVGDRIVIHSVSISLVDPTQATKDRINELNIERAKTQIAIQRKETATNEAEANRIIAESTKDTNVLVSNCLKIVSEAVPGTLPAGFTCFPGANPATVAVR